MNDRYLAYVPAVVSTLVVLFLIAMVVLSAVAGAYALAGGVGLIAVLFGLNVAYELRKATSDAREHERIAPFIRPARPADDTH